MLAYLRICAILILFFALAVLGGESAFTGIDFTNQPSYSVLKITDGDTIHLSIDGQDTRVRLIGVGTPELTQQYGIEAARFFSNLLKGEEVYNQREPGLDKDINKRELLYLYRAPDGLFVNEEIIRQGYGKVYIEKPFQYKEIFLRYEQKAKEAQKGIWETTATEPPGPENPIFYITNSGKKYHRLRRQKIYI